MSLLTYFLHILNIFLKEFTYPTTYQAGFVHLIGRPNAGKSTLFNALIKEPLSIVTYKPQTTRQDILGIVNTSSSQIIYVDTPGYIQAKYALQKSMVKSIQRSLPGADILLWVVDAREKDIKIDIPMKFIHNIPTFLLLNKIDLLTPKSLSKALATWASIEGLEQVLPISARLGTHIDTLRKILTQFLPEHPPYYDEEDITDKPKTFFVAEAIRKMIFLQYQQEVPYSTAVIVTDYQEKTNTIRIEATIYIERNTQ